MFYTIKHFDPAKPCDPQCWWTGSAPPEPGLYVSEVTKDEDGKLWFRIKPGSRVPYLYERLYNRKVAAKGEANAR